MVRLLAAHSCRYDAVTTEGKLEWQDTLNHLNAAFFDACDGLFTNYCWKASPG
jgi:endo-beta-N-acetylglucosaminidase D